MSTTPQTLFSRRTNDSNGSNCNKLATKYGSIISSGEGCIVWEHYYQTAKGKICSIWFQVQPTERAEKKNKKNLCIFVSAKPSCSYYKSLLSSNLERQPDLSMQNRHWTESTDTGISVEDDTAVFPSFFLIYLLFYSFTFISGNFPQEWQLFFFPPYFHWPFEQLLEGLMPCLRASEHQWG